MGRKEVAVTTVLETLSSDDALVPALAWSAALETAALRAGDKYPLDKERIKNGVALIVKGHVTLLQHGAQVRSRRPDVDLVYNVNGHCTCEAQSRALDRGDTDYRCAHRWAAALYRKTLTLLCGMSTATYTRNPENPLSADVHGFVHDLPHGSGYAFTYEGKFRIVHWHDARLIIHAKCAWVEDGAYVGLVPQAADDGLLGIVGVGSFAHLKA